MNRILALFFFSYSTWLFVAPLTAQEKDEGLLSPRHWSRAELEQYRNLGLRGGARGAIRTKGPMIVGSSCPFAVHAGIVTLRKGGSAADAAIVTALSQITRLAGSWNSFAGILYLVYFEAATGKVYALNSGYNTVLGEDSPATIPRWPKPSGRTALVPGFMAGIEAAHKRFGSLPFGALFGPALYLADEGFELGNTLPGMSASRGAVLSRREETRRVFTREDGKWYCRGDRFCQPELAKTLRGVAKQGARYMYTGEWAKRFVEVVREEGGRMILEDLKQYKPAWTEPLSAHYGSFRVHTLPAPELGSVQLIEAVNMLEESNLAKMGHYARSADALYWLMQICRFGHIATYTPGVYQPNPNAKLRAGQIAAKQRLAPGSGARNWRRIQKPGWEKKYYLALKEKVSHSDANVVVDGKGNMAVLLHSINTVTWGTTGIFVDGVSIPDSGAFQQGMIERVGPGARLPNITNPLIVTKGGKSYLGAAVIGSSLHEMMLQSLVDILDFGMRPEESVRTPKFWGAVWRRNPVDDPTTHPQAVNKGSFPKDLLDAVRKQGQAIEVLEPNQRGLRVSYWVGIKIDPKTGIRYPGYTMGCVEGDKAP